MLRKRLVFHLNDEAVVAEKKGLSGIYPLPSPPLHADTTRLFTFGCECSADFERVR